MEIDCICLNLEKNLLLSTCRDYPRRGTGPIWFSDLIQQLFEHFQGHYRAPIQYTRLHCRARVNRFCIPLINWITLQIRNFVAHIIEENCCLNSPLQFHIISSSRKISSLRDIREKVNPYLSRLIFSSLLFSLCARFDNSATDE